MRLLLALGATFLATSGVTSVIKHSKRVCLPISCMYCTTTALIFLFSFAVRFGAASHTCSVCFAAF